MSGDSRPGVGAGTGVTLAVYELTAAEIASRFEASMLTLRGFDSSRMGTVTVRTLLS